MLLLGNFSDDVEVLDEMLYKFIRRTEQPPFFVVVHIFKVHPKLKKNHVAK